MAPPAARDSTMVLAFFLLLLPLGATVELTKFAVDIEKSVTMNCSNDMDRSRVTPLHWVLPDYTAVRLNQSADSVQVMSQGWTLHIPSVGPEHLGDYMCYANDSSGNPVYYRKKVVLRDQSAWERYRLNIIVGVVATAAGIVILAAICIIYNCRWEIRHGNLDKKPFVTDGVSGGSGSAVGHDNLVFDKTYETTVNDTKL